MRYLYRLVGLRSTVVTAVETSIADLYRTMCRIRAFEERVGRRFRDGDVHGFVHVSIGQEAVAAGACGALAPGDWITTTHRGHGHCIAKGADPTGMFAELFGRADGLCHGKGGSMHIADPRLGILGANGIVGAGIPLAVGAALTSHVRRDGAVAVAFFGDGAVHCGAFHEGVTLAVGLSLPVVFVCEDNGYAEFTASGRWGGPAPAVRAEGYGVAAERIDGNDVLAVREAVARRVAEARDGKGPQFVEAHTARLRGHFEGDAETYRPEGQLLELQGRDPLRHARGVLADDAAADAIVDEAEAEMDAAVEAALRAPYPEPSAVLEDIYG
jgi:TPP-dependent pyruvate/acetoin dehydrogenase alpha subunit